MTGQRTGDHTLLRRDFLHVGTIPLMGLGLSTVLASESAKASTRAKDSAKNVILVWLNGGPSSIDMWDLKNHARSSIRGEFRSISTTAPDIEICEHLPLMTQQMRHCSLIRSVTHTIAEHGQGTEYVLTGNPISPALKYPSMGSIVSSQTTSESRRSVPAYIDLSGLEIGQPGYLGSAHSPFVIDRFQNLRAKPSGDPLALADGFTVHDLTRKNELLTKIERGFRRFDQTARAEEMSDFQNQALNILTAGRTRDALDVFSEDQDVIQRYGSASPGLSALAARRLIQAGVRFVTMGMNGWDTHSQNFAQLRNDLLPQLDRALSALIEDLAAENLLQETIVYCVGEFGRTPEINREAGRDHWARAMSVLVAGGGFCPGFVYGATDRNGTEPERNACSPADVNATILNQLGIGPQTRLSTRSGRPMPVFRDATILDELCSTV